MDWFRSFTWCVHKSRLAAFAGAGERLVSGSSPKHLSAGGRELNVWREARIGQRPHKERWTLEAQLAKSYLTVHFKQ